MNSGIDSKRKVYAVLGSSSCIGCQAGMTQFYDHVLVRNLKLQSSQIRTCLTLHDFIDGLKWLSAKLATEKCIAMTFFTGHGNRVRDTTGDEIDGFDEYYIFDDGLLLDDDFTILMNATPMYDEDCLLITFSDCCSSGSTIDFVRQPASIPNSLHWISVGATTDVEDAFMDGDGGAFTSFLAECFVDLCREPYGSWGTFLQRKQIELSWVEELQHVTVRTSDDSFFRRCLICDMDDQPSCHCATLDYRL